MDHPSDNELRRLEEELREPLTRGVFSPPLPSETAHLIASLQGEFDLLKMEAAPPKLDFNPQVDPPSLRQLLRSQLRLNLKYIFLASAAVFTMLILLIDPDYPLDSMGGIPGGIFPLITPLLLIASMLFSSRTWDRGMRAVETITPYPPALVLYSRLLMVTFIVIGMALISTVALGIKAMNSNETHFLFGPFVLEWLGVLLLTGGTTMYMMFRKGMVASILSAILVYGIWIVIQGQIYEVTQFLKTPVDFIVLLVGAALLISSYGYSRKDKVSPGRTAL
ncbi:hypothetical protein [Paenibacillus faecalis]|uniref:hypothetical protein n=1 Tax=Paenibacillus faecalis TaxID=2079532 RepID=UPI000D10FE61|nr:hypothetical protein [Paenibacillus faecalis]